MVGVFLGFSSIAYSHALSQALPDESQVWASVLNDFIRNGGANDIPRIYNSKTGFSKLLK